MGFFLVFMKVYYVNKFPQPNGEHEVHKDGCSFLPRSEYRLFLGIHSNCADAMIESKKHYAKSNGCFSCSHECHTS